MKKIVAAIYQNRYFVFFILLFSYVHSIYTRISVRRQIDAYLFTPEAALGSLVAAGVLYLVILFFIKRGQQPEPFTTGKMLKTFAWSLLVYVLIMQLSGLVTAFIFNTFERNFNRHTLFLSVFSDFLNGFIYGSFFLAYYYYRINKNHQQQLIKYNQALAESKINQLKTQLNPHFLFNNLNILDQLIEEDKHKASDFLNEFADIYRYVLQGSDRKLILISEELDFAEQYFRLMRYKYGNAYQLRIESKNTNGYIVPLTLQLLVENAVQHNLGITGNPVYIDITITGEIVVSNNLKRKRNTKPTSGRALVNLKEQYKLLTGRPMKIEESNNSFIVTVPVIQIQEK